MSYSDDPYVREEQAGAQGLVAGKRLKKKLGRKLSLRDLVENIRHHDQYDLTSVYLEVPYANGRGPDCTQ